MSKSWNEVGAKSMVAVLADRDARIISLESQLAAAKGRVVELEEQLLTQTTLLSNLDHNWQSENRRLRKALEQVIGKRAEACHEIARDTLAKIEEALK